MAGRVLHFFPTPVIFDELPDAEDLNRELETAILGQQKRDAGLTLSNRNGWQSKRDFPQWAGEAGRRIVEHATRLASEHTGHGPNRPPPSWNVDTWANVSASGGFNMPHIHGGTFWSAAFYVRSGAGEGGHLFLP